MCDHKRKEWTFINDAHSIKYGWIGLKAHCVKELICPIVADPI